LRLIFKNPDLNKWQQDRKYHRRKQVETVPLVKDFVAQEQMVVQE